MKYTKGKGYLVGSFSEEEVRDGKDKIALSKAKEELNLKFSNVKVGKKNGKQVLHVWACDYEDLMPFVM